MTTPCESDGQLFLNFRVNVTTFVAKLLLALRVACDEAIMSVTAKFALVWIVTSFSSLFGAQDPWNPRC